MPQNEAREKALAWLRAAGVPYTLVEHPPAHTMADITRLGVGRYGTVCKNLFLRDSRRGRRHLLLVVRGDARVDLKQLGKALNEPLSFASAARLEKYLGLHQGEVSPLGIMNDTARAVEVWFDDSLAADEVVGVHPCDNTASVFMPCGGLRAIIEAHGNTVGALALPRTATTAEEENP